MKTSLEIDDRLYQAARLHAAREHTTVRALVERGLAEVLGLGAAPAADEAERERDLADLRALCAQIAALPVLAPGTDEELIGYDESGGFA